MRTKSIGPVNAYWNQGLAEITSYDLTQARYGELHEGSALLIFVTEPFSLSKQVKLENPKTNDKIEVLKFNFVKMFNTGIYPYSMMSSTFSSIDTLQNGRALKLTSTSQEWCGHTVSQLNRRDLTWNISQFSYFEREGDTTLSLGKYWLEDGIWNQIRINPDMLPLPELKKLPSSMFLRLSHSELKAYQVEIDKKIDGKMTIYSVRYPEMNRILKISFTTEFPYTIESWEETYQSGWGSNAKMMTTTGKRKAREMLDYWNLHSNDDIHWSNKLGL